MKIMLISLIISFVLTGCANTKTLATCNSYKNNICDIKKTIEITECKSPVIINNKTYCK